MGFGYYYSLSSLTFGSNAKLDRIESKVFLHCAALKSICIPQSIRVLENDWYSGSSLNKVLFESGESLQRMIQDETVDLNFDFEVEICDWDSVMIFPGYSVSIIPGADNSVRLMKNENE
jgi:hypothetical protein